MSQFDQDDIPDLVPITNVSMDDDSELPPDLIEISPQTMTNQNPNPTPSPNPDASPSQIPQINVNKPPVPLTILTGWLGSGKTTLLHNIVATIAKKNQTVAILQNETSAFMGVEKALTLTDEENDVFGEMLEIATGCVCCSVRSDFLLAIDTLLSKRDFDYVVLECSGIADVGNLINSLWADRALGSLAVLDAVVCLVDVEQLLLQLFDEASTAQSQSLTQPKAPVLNSSLNILKNQLVYSDVAIVNKMDRCLFESLPTSLLSGSSNSTNLVTTQHGTDLTREYSQLDTRRYLSWENGPNLAHTDELTPVLHYLNEFSLPTCSQASYKTDLGVEFKGGNQKQCLVSHPPATPTQLLSLAKSLSAQLHTIMSYMFRVNPTLTMMFSHQSAIDVKNILNLQKYSLHSLNIIDPLSQINHANETHQRGSMSPTSGNGHGIKDRPQIEYKLRDGVTVWTENAALIPSKYLNQHCNQHQEHHEHQDCSHEHHEHGVCGDMHDCGEHCEPSHQSQGQNDQNEQNQGQNDHNTNTNNGNQHDPHGISTVILTIKQPLDFSDKTPSPPHASRRCVGWGFDIRRLTSNLDEYLFGHIQRADEDDWSQERKLFRDRFHHDRESPEVIMEELLNKQKERILNERREQIEKVVKKFQNSDQNDKNDQNDQNSDQNDQSDQTPSSTHPPSLPTATATEDSAILEVPQMDSIEKEVIYRMKGVFSIRNRIPKWYLQSVFNTFDLLPAEKLQTDEHSSLHDEIYSDLGIYKEWEGKSDVWQRTEARYSSLIVIGVNIDVERLVNVFVNSLPPQQLQSGSEKED